jgi:lysophospholipase L1-like esterase
MNYTTIILIAFLLLGQKSIAQDWANLARFQKDNAELNAPSKKENRVVFMGNSITEGWSNIQPEFFEGKPYINRGISGQTTPQMLIRFRQDVIDLQPKVVVILAGTNDIAGNTGPSTVEMIQDNIACMAEIADANGIKVILASTLPAFDYPWAKGKNPNQKIPALNKWMKKYAKRKGFIYLDYFSAMDDGNNGLKKVYSSDGVHPNKLGYEVMAPLAEKAIRKALK